MEWLFGGWIGFTLGAAALWWQGRSARAKLNQGIEAAREENLSKAEKLARSEASLEALEKRLEQITADRESLKESFGSLAATQLKGFGILKPQRGASRDGNPYHLASGLAWAALSRLFPRAHQAPGQKDD